MHDRSIVVALLMSVAHLAFAQDSHSLNGTWRAQFEGTHGANREATLVVTDKGATWKEFGRQNAGKLNRCVAREFPVAVHTRSKNRISLDIEAGDVIEGCSDLHLTVRWVDEKTLEGSTRAGASVKITRD